MFKKEKKTKKVNKEVVKKPIVNENSEKKEKVKKEKKNSKFLNHIKKHRKKYTLSLILVGILALVTLSIYVINIYLINKEYAKYEEKMVTYGFSLLYDNESPKSYEKVTNLEAVKIVLGTIYNTYDATEIGYQPKGEYEGDEWVKTAEIFGIVEKNKINKDNINDNISYWDFIKMYLNCRNKKLNLAVSSTGESNFKNLNSFSQEQKKYINDLVENGLIKNQKENLDLDKDVIKGQVNEIVVNYVTKYNSIVDEGETLVTKEESMPKNKELYPYIVYSIPNEVYEFKHVNQEGYGYISPKNLYKSKKQYYDQMEYRLNNYYDKILNIDYKNIDVQSFRASIDDYLLYNYEDSVFEEYVNYVKENQIVIQGIAKVLLPIVYYDEIDFRVRTKLEFKIVNSKTDKNILFGDSRENPNTPVTYKNKEYKIYVDVPMARALNVVSYRTEIRSVINLLSDKTNIENNTL